jgi:hypothetical protein
MPGVVMEMMSDKIVEAGDIGDETLIELLDGLIAAAIHYFTPLYAVYTKIGTNGSADEILD